MKTTDQLKSSGSTWLPYTLLDQVLEVAPVSLPSVEELRQELAGRLKKMSKLGGSGGSQLTNGTGIAVR